MPDKTSITQIVCGIQFSNSFKLFDKWGEIADRILYEKPAQKIFRCEYYNRISNDSGYQRSLFNDITQNSLRLTQNSLIITHNIEEGTANFDSEYTYVKNIVFSYLISEVINSYSLVVNRVGIVFTCLMTASEISTYKHTIIQPSICESITDFRFSKKETTPAGLAQKDTNNYVNKIITIGKLGDSKSGISYDYQYFYSPFNAELSKKAEPIFDSALAALESDIFDECGNKNGKEK